MRSRTAFRPTCFDVFALERRELLTLAAPLAIQPFQPPAPTMANVGSDLKAIYNAYIRKGGDVSKFSTTYPRYLFQGNTIEVSIRVQGNFSTALATLEASGMKVLASSSSYDLVVGYVPIGSLPTISRLPPIGSVNALMRPVLS